MNTLVLDEKKYVVIEQDEYQGMIDIVEDKMDTKFALKMIDNCKDEESIPAEIINRIYLDEEPRLKVWREYRGFSGRQLAKEVGISSSYLSDIENGKKDGSVSVVKRIAEILRVDIDDIV